MSSSTKPFDAPAREAALAERAERLVDLGRAAGADEAEVYASHTESVKVAFEKGDLKLTSVEEGAAVGLRVLRERRQGFAATNQMDGAALGVVAEDANALARLAPPDEANVLPEPGGDATDLGLGVSTLDRLDVAAVVEHARETVARTLGHDPRLSLDQASVSLSRASVAVRSTAGAAATESDVALSLSLFGMAIDGEDVGGFDSWSATVRDLDALEAATADCVERFTSAALGNLAAGAAESYRGPVLFSPAAFRSVFVSALLGAANAKAVQRGRSPLAGKLGETVAVPGFSLADEPHDRGLNGACAFDREGVPTRRFPVVDGGVLRGFLYNGYAARVDGVRSTGHGVGGSRAVPGIGVHAPCVAPGAGGDPAAMRRALGRGLVVQRFSGSVDSASGDFSGVAKSARWVEGGEVVRPVRETLFAGNVFELLPRIVALSSAAESVMGGARVPWVLVDGLSVTAG